MFNHTIINKMKDLNRLEEIEVKMRLVYTECVQGNKTHLVRKGLSEKAAMADYKNTVANWREIAGQYNQNDVKIDEEYDGFSYMLCLQVRVDNDQWFSRKLVLIQDF